MSVQSVIAPLVVQAFLTLTILFVMAYRRFRAFRAGTVKVVDAASSTITWPADAAQAQRSFLNQFETPVLFYALVPLVIITKTYDTLFVALAWLWVATRIAHAFVHCTSNALSLRFPTFLAGVFLLVVLWVIFAIRLTA